jgi:hypothetical protein
VGVCALLLLITPWIAWLSQKPQFRSILILDKTVAETSYREHRGLIWILQHLKIQWPSDHRTYDKEKDYSGFVPLANHQYDIRPLPSNLSSYDLLYLADTYGVYQDDFYGNDLIRAQGTRSRLIYGGIEDGEMAQIEQAVASGVPLIAEFNTYQSPTNTAVRTRMMALLGIQWSGWIGRYFENLKAGLEIPEWALTNYRQQYGKPWDFRGAGFLYVSDDNRIVVLREGVETGRKKVWINFPDSVAKRYGVENDRQYLYWFDIVSPLPGTEELATYHMDLTPEGKKLLASFGLPETFPAIVQRMEGKTPIYYFAGDFVDMKFSTFFLRFKWIDKLQRILSVMPGEEEGAFFWGVYFPFMKTVLNSVTTSQPHTP